MYSCMSFIYVIYLLILYMPILFCCFTCGQRWPNKEVQTNNSKVHGANMGPTWDMSAPDGPHVGPKNLAIWVTVSVQMHLTDTRSIFAAITVVILSSLVNLFHSGYHENAFLLLFYGNDQSNNLHNSNKIYNNSLITFTDIGNNLLKNSSYQDFIPFTISFFFYFLWFNSLYVTPNKCILFNRLGRAICVIHIRLQPYHKL